MTASQFAISHTRVWQHASGQLVDRFGYSLICRFRTPGRYPILSYRAQTFGRRTFHKKYALNETPYFFVVQCGAWHIDCASLPTLDLLGKTMTKDTTAVLSAAKKRPARLADCELSHLEAVLGLAGRRSVATALRGLDLAYWSARVASIATQYDLIMSQTQRVAALSRSLAALGPPDKTIAERSTRLVRLAA
jgi:hypothetical protein